MLLAKQESSQQMQGGRTNVEQGQAIIQRCKTLQQSREREGRQRVQIGSADGDAVGRSCLSC